MVTLMVLVLGLDLSQSQSQNRNEMKYVMSKWKSIGHALHNATTRSAMNSMIAMLWPGFVEN